VCDINTHALHVLSEQGDILTCKVMEDTGIKYPMSLNIDIRGQFLNYYKAPFNLKKNGRCQKEKCQLSNINNKTWFIKEVLL
jgi:hypothetical protein